MSLASTASPLRAPVTIRITLLRVHLHGMFHLYSGGYAATCAAMSYPNIGAVVGVCPSIVHLSVCLSVSLSSSHLLVQTHTQTVIALLLFNYIPGLSTFPYFKWKKSDVSYLKPAGPSKIWIYSRALLEAILSQLMTHSLDITCITSSCSLMHPCSQSALHCHVYIATTSRHLELITRSSYTSTQAALQSQLK